MELEEGGRMQKLILEAYGKFWFIIFLGFILILSLFKIWYFIKFFFIYSV